MQHSASRVHVGSRHVLSTETNAIPDVRVCTITNAEIVLHCKCVEFHVKPSLLLVPVRVICSVVICRSSLPPQLPTPSLPQ